MKSILLANSSEKQRESLATCLRKHGYGVTTFANGLDLFDAIRAGNGDLVLAGEYLPKLDGLGVLKLMQFGELGRFKRVHMIILLETGGAETRREIELFGGIVVDRADFDTFLIPTIENLMRDAVAAAS